MMSNDQIWDLLGHQIQIELDTGDVRRQESTTGHLMTRDPVSQSLLIAKIEENSTSIKSIEWIPSCSVKSIRKLKNTENPEIHVAIEKYFENDGIEGGSSGAEDSEEDIKKRAHRVVNYLKSHHLDVVEKPNGTYIIAGTVRFERPYHNANLYCDIPIVLKRILKLVEEI